MLRTSIALLGDSIFDNGVYVPGELPVIEQLRAKFDRNTTNVEMLAVDGAITQDVLEHQIPSLSEKVDFIVLSTGGNDALQNIEILSDNIDRSAPEVLSLFYGIRETFRQNYCAVLENLSRLERPLLVCTIYNPDFRRDVSTESLQALAETALSFFNDVIVQEALSRSLDVLDLREIFTESDDFANPIEPSAKGGEKIASKLGCWAVATKRNSASRLSLLSLKGTIYRHLAGKYRGLRSKINALRLSFMKTATLRKGSDPYSLLL